MYVKKIIALLCMISFFQLVSPVEANASVASSRIYGKDIYGASIEVSKAGWYASENVILVSAEHYSDALCASEMAKYLHAPVLFTDGGILNTDIENEIKRLKAKNIYAIGLTDSFSDRVVQKVKAMGLNYTFIGGNDRYDISAAVAGFLADKYSVGNTAILVSGDSPIDVLSAVFAGTLRKMPVLLTTKGDMPGSVKNFIQANGITKAYIMGGNDIISDEIASRFRSSERVYGSSPYQRSALLYKKFENYIDFSKLYIAPGSNLHYGLVGTALAVNEKLPVMFADKVLSSSSKMFIETKLSDIKGLVVIGDNNMVSGDVLQEISAESDKNAGISAQKTYSDFSQYISENFYINGIGDDIIKLDNVSTGQKAGDEGSIYIYLDMNYDNYNKLNKLLAGGGNSRQIVEAWMKSIIHAVNSQYPGKIINCELWYVETYDNFSDAGSSGEVEYDTVSNKWNVMKRWANFGLTKDGQFISAWMQQ